MDMSIDSKFFHFMNKIADCMILSVLWSVFSIPIVTSGAAGSALYYCVLKVLREDSGSPVKDFWRSFRANFRQSSIVFCLFAAVCCAVSAVGTAIYAASQTDRTLTNIYLVFLFLLLFFIAWLHYILSYIARFEAPLKIVLKNSLVICLANLPASISFAVLFAVVLGGVILTLPASAMSFLLVPGLYAWVNSLLMERIYRKYLPDTSSETDPPA